MHRLGCKCGFWLGVRNPRFPVGPCGAIEGPQITCQLVRAFPTPPATPSPPLLCAYLCLSLPPTPTLCHPPPVHLGPCDGPALSPPLTCPCFCPCTSHPVFWSQPLIFVPVPISPVSSFAPVLLPCTLKGLPVPCLCP